jgi:hypothetical protein
MTDKKQQIPPLGFAPVGMTAKSGFASVGMILQ